MNDFLSLCPAPQYENCVDLEPLQRLARRLGTSIVSIDTETTSFLDSPSFGVVEIGLAVVEPGGRLFVADTLLNPGLPIHPKASEANGLTSLDVKGAPCFPSVMAGRPRSLLALGLVTGYRVDAFDLPGLAREAARYSVEPISHPFVCDVYPAMKLYESIVGRFTNHKLTTIAKELGVELESDSVVMRPHRALYDAVLALAVAAQLCSVIGEYGFMHPRLFGVGDPSATASRPARGEPRRSMEQVAEQREHMRTAVEASVRQYAASNELQPPLSIRQINDAITNSLPYTITNHGCDRDGAIGVSVADATNLRARIAGARYQALVSLSPPPVEEA